MGLFSRSKKTPIDSGDGRVMTGLPAVLPPTGALQQLVTICQTMADVSEVHFFQLYDPASGDPPHLVVGVRLDTAAYSVERFAEVAPVILGPIQAVTAPGEPIDCAPLNATDMFSDWEGEQSLVYTRDDPGRAPWLYAQN